MTSQLRTRVGWSALLVLFGAGWGLTQPLAKIAVSGGYAPFGIIFWQLAIGAVLLGAINLARRGRWPVSRDALGIYLLIALLGTLIPNFTSYTAIAYLPAGIMSILIGTVPMFAFPLAILFGEDRYGHAKFAGLLLGLSGVLLILLPDASLPPGTAAIWILIALIGEVCYAMEAIYVGKWGTRGLDALEVLLGASILGAILLAPVAVISGQFINPFVPFGPPEWSLVGLSLLHALIYVGYVWMVGRTGAVFASQVSYLITGFGLIWAIIILRETYPATVWIALVAMMAGMALVSPRKVDLLEHAGSSGDTGN